jgi:hypothetical protein
MQNHMDLGFNIHGPVGELTFTTCSVVDTAQAQTGGGRRRQVVINGRRVKTIDVHAHCIIPEAIALAGRTTVDSRGPHIDEVGPIRIRDDKASMSKR